ncbi:M20/M25/M40 family metallo-hydrolase [Patescibacteria group bacterium]
MNNQQLVNLTKRLIAIPSYVDKKNNENKLEKFLYKYLKRNFGWLKIYRQKVEKDRYNLICTNSNNPSLVFICHMDTVKPSSNKKQMLNLRIVGNKLYGLGAADMKGGIAAILEACRILSPTGSNKIALIFDCDEEYYFKGIKKVLSKYKWRPKLVICPEPTDLEIVNGCRGLIEIEFDVIGKTVHAGSPEKGVNAIEKAIEIVKTLRKEIIRNDIASLGKTTVNLSSINGGRLQDEKIIVQANAVADVARVLLDIRPADPGMNAQKVQKLIKSIARKINVKCPSQRLVSLWLKRFKVNLDYKPYFADRTSTRIIEKAIKSTGLKVKYTKNLGEKGFFEAALIANTWNCPAISLGPGPANMAHKTDEYVDIDSLEITKNIFIYIIKFLLYDNE